tara:strand:+ start:26 stop:160 length:135 start_codon:yes stop_codon:yes gene_type:complete
MTEELRKFIEKEKRIEERNKKIWKIIDKIYFPLAILALILSIIL